MKSLLRNRFLRHSMPRIFFFGMMGATLFVHPSFIVNGAFYAVAGYLLFVSVFGIVDRIRIKGRKSRRDYAGIIVSAVLLLFVANSLVFARYLAHLAPLCLGAFLMLEGLYYFSVSLYGPEGWQRGILAVLSILVFLSGMSVVLFTLGFGVHGLLGLSAVSGIASGLSCAYALTACLLYRGKTKRHIESEETI